MIAELGSFCLALALCISIAQGVLPILGAQQQNQSWMAFARPAAYTQWFIIVIAYVLLTYAFITHDLSLIHI